MNIQFKQLLRLFIFVDVFAARGILFAVVLGNHPSSRASPPVRFDAIHGKPSSVNSSCRELREGNNENGRRKSFFIGVFEDAGGPGTCRENFWGCVARKRVKVILLV